MKKIALLFLIILFAATYSLQAQKAFSGEIRFETKLDGTDDPNLLASGETQIINVLILGNKSKTTVKNEMVAFDQVWDGDKGTSAFVIEITGMGKYYKKTTAEEKNEKMKLKDFSFTYEDDYKTICGYKCQKVVVTVTDLEDDSTTEIILYVTKEIGTSKLNGEQLPGLEGFPLMTKVPLEQHCEGCFSVMEAIKITPKKIKEVDFLLPSDAKNLDDSPEIKEMLGIE
jgi:GLPGLI family protein